MKKGYCWVNALSDLIITQIGWRTEDEKMVCYEAISNIQEYARLARDARVQQNKIATPMWD